MHSHLADTVYVALISPALSVRMHNGNVGPERNSEITIPFQHVGLVDLLRWQISHLKRQSW